MRRALFCAYAASAGKLPGRRREFREQDVAGRTRCRSLGFRAGGRTDDIEKDLREYILHEPLPRVNLAIAAGELGKIAVERLSERGACH